MLLPTELVNSVEDATNRLIAETILASVGRDDGLIPAYSLLGDLSEACSLAPVLREPLVAQHRALEKLLDSAQPFDEASLAQLRRLTEWLSKAVDQMKNDAPVLSFAAGAEGASAPKAVVAVAAETAPVDGLMDFDLAGNRELLTEFHAEAVDHLQQIEAALLVLDQNPHDQDAVAAIFRSFHTIKGNAGFLGLRPMQTLAHEVESLLDLVRAGKRELNAVMITEILKSRDALQVLLHQVGLALEKGEMPREIVLVSQLVAAIKRLASGEAGADPDTAADQPTAALAPVVPIGSAPPPEAPTNTKSSASSTVRVGTEKLDSLMNVVGELVIVQSQLIEATRTSDSRAPALQRNVAQLARITKELQHTALSLRMIPIKPLFQKMERLCRDLARDLGKRVTWVTEGEDTDLDRSVIEEIGDPLVHMVRNGLDHGLETPAERVASGKSEAGTLQLRAYHQGSHIVIELQDDGRGIDPEKILAKARRQGLVTEGATLSREEMFNLLFLPGFSTAAQVTAVSGRGVGMDVVKRNIEKLRGKIEIASEVGKGSTFKIKLPLTTAIIDGLVVRVGAERFIVPSTSIQRAMRPLRSDISTVQGRGEAIDVKGRLMPLYRLHQLFNIRAAVENPWDGIVMIVEASGRTCALLVDEMISKQEVVIKNLGILAPAVPGIAGGAILGDGEIALIFDPSSLLRAA